MRKFTSLLLLGFVSLFYFILVVWDFLRNIHTKKTKNVPWHILAPAVVACDIISIRSSSAHSAGGFLYNRKCNSLLYKKPSTCNSKRFPVPYIFRHNQLLVIWNFYFPYQRSAGFLTYRVHIKSPSQFPSG